MSKDVSVKGYKRLTIDDLNTEGCLNFLEAFLNELSIDFTTSYRNHLMYLGDNHYKEHYLVVRNFILSDYFHMLTGLIGEDIVYSLETSVRNEVA